MRTYRTTVGPVSERPYYTLREIEDICADELRRVELYPVKPEPIRIERFVEKRFGVHPEYAELPDSLLGYTRFGPRGVEEIVVARALSEQGSRVAERQVSSTLAHEAGHGLLQAHLFVLERERLTSLFGADLDPAAPKILCRQPGQHARGSAYDGRWWEFQANQAIGALLLPRSLVSVAIAEFLSSSGTFGRSTLKGGKQEDAGRVLSQTFDVNPAVARIRLEELFPESAIRQLTL